MKQAARKGRAALSALLAFALSFSMVGTAFAAEDSVKYVNLGDSMSNGYGFTSYDSVSSGFGKVIRDSYPYQVAYDTEWELEQLAMTSMRAADLEFFLTADKDTAGVAQEATWSAAQGAFVSAGDYATWTEFTNSVDGRCIDAGGVADMASALQVSIKEADVINLAVGSADFVSFLPSCLFGYMGLGNDTSDLDWIDASVFAEALAANERASKAVSDISSIMVGALGDYLDPGKIASAKNVVEYCVANLLLSYEGVLDRIVALNEDADIMIVGIPNVLLNTNVEVTNDETGVVESIDVGTVIQPALGIINTYFADLARAKDADDDAFSKADAYFVPVDSLTPSVLVDDFASYYKASSYSDGYLRECMVSAVSDVVFGMLGEGFVLMDGFPPIESITLQDVLAYESNYSKGTSAFGAWVKQDKGKALSVAVYLGFEQALFAQDNPAINLDAIDGDALMALLDEGTSGMTSRLKDGVMDQVTSVALEVIFNRYVSAAGDGSTIFGAAVVLGPKLIAKTLQADDAMPSVLYLFARLIVGDGMGSHLDADGHEDMASLALDVAETVVPGHTHAFGDWCITTQATCTTPGSQSRECVDCGKTEYAGITATHTFGEWEVTIEPACKAKGVETATCTVQGCGHVETREIPESHGDPEVLPRVEPTEEEPGLTEGSKCGLCGETLVAQEVIPALGSANTGGGGGGLMMPMTDIATLSYSNIPSTYAYSGAPITISPVIVDTEAGATLAQGTDFTVAIKDSLNTKVAQITAPGTYTVTISGTGSYSGTVSYTVTVTEAADIEIEGMFKDVDAEAKGDYGKLWYTEYLEYVVVEGLMGGYTSGPDKGKFGPYDNISRAQVATILYRAACAESPVLESAYGSTTDAGKFGRSSAFKDASGGQYYTAALNWAKAAGIMTGDASTNYATVRPNDPVSRQELCLMLARYANGGFVPKTSLNASAAQGIKGMDEVQGWAVDGVNWAVNNGIIGGVDNGDGTTSMNPGDTTWRAAAAKMLTVTLKDVLG